MSTDKNIKVISIQHHHKQRMWGWWIYNFISHFGYKIIFLPNLFQSDICDVYLIVFQ